MYPIFPTVRGVWRKLATCVLLFQIDLRWPIGFIHFWPNLVSLHFCFQRKHLLHSCERWTLLCLFYKWRNWNPERQRELLKVTQQLGGRAGTPRLELFPLHILHQPKHPQSPLSEDPSSFSPRVADVLKQSDLSLKRRTHVMPRSFRVPRRRSSKHFLEKYSLSCTGTEPWFQPDPNSAVRGFQVSSGLTPSPTGTNLPLPFLRGAELYRNQRSQI